MVRKVAITAVGLVVSLCVAACGGGGPSPSSNTPVKSRSQPYEGPASSPSQAPPRPGQEIGGKSTLGPDDPVPEFSGPWAGAFERAYRESTTEAQREVLKDGKLTEQEMSRLQDLFKQCLESKGYFDIKFEDDGSMSVGEPEGVTDQKAESDYLECSNKSVGEVELLYQQLRRNPDAVDEQQAMADCLVRQGLVEPGYTGEDYTRDTPDNYPFDSDSKLFGECIDDPLNAGK